MILKKVGYIFSSSVSIKRCASLGLANVQNVVSPQQIAVNGREFNRDSMTNVTPNILAHLDRHLHLQPNHPLTILKQRIISHFYKNFVGNSGNPIFSVYDNLDPVVSLKQNFDSLLIPSDHISRKKSECYYINKDYLLRAHATAHQSELISMGLNNFIAICDVYRRDEIDSSHYPVFHQADAARLCTRAEVFRAQPIDCGLELFEAGKRTESKQAQYTLEASKLMEHELKTTLVGLSKTLFGADVKYRWVDAYFPFTHPSWELEVWYNNDWMEVLGCGIMEHKILEKAGAQDRIGWAFGLGLERLAMRMFQIPDIRLFWSRDTGFLNQFDASKSDVVYKAVSAYPQCSNDISFWVPDEAYSSNDFYDLAREVGGDIVEQVSLVDEFTHPKNGKTSHCYRVVYRHMEKTLTQEEVNVVHKRIEEEATSRLKIKLR